MLHNSASRYGSLSRALHWLTALLIFGLVFVGLYVADLDDKDPSRAGILNFHKSFGVLVFILLVIRLVWFRISPAPKLPSVFSAGEQRLTHGIKGLLYLLMALIPISGAVMSVAAGKAVPFFGLFELPMFLEKNKALAGAAHEAHEVLAYAILALVVVHVAGAIKHRMQNPGSERDVLRRML